MGDTYDQQYGEGPSFRPKPTEPREYREFDRALASAKPSQVVPVPASVPPAVAFEAARAAHQVAGRKDDGGKLDVTLFFDDLPHAIEGVTEVLQWAITKKQPKPYVRGSWQQVPEFQRRYRAAQLRHELNRSKALIEPGRVVEPTDAETELLELQHIATDAMFRLEMALRKRKGLPVPEGA